MVAYLEGHFRYNTMNSWNRATSYARNVKINRLTFPDSDTRNRAYELVGVDEAFDDIRFLMQEFAEAHEYEWQVGFNGRSSGYLVLYPGGRRPSQYKSWCSACGQGNCTDATESNKKCGRCGNDTRYNQQRFEIFTHPGKGVDQGEDFSEWSVDRLRDRVNLVMDFDKLCDDCVATFINFCKTHKAEEVEVRVPKKVMIATEI